MSGRRVSLFIVVDGIGSMQIETFDWLHAFSVVVVVILCSFSFASVGSHFRPKLVQPIRRAQHDEIGHCLCLGFGFTWPKFSPLEQCKKEDDDDDEKTRSNEEATHLPRHTSLQWPAITSSLAMMVAC